MDKEFIPNQVYFRCVVVYSFVVFELFLGGKVKNWEILVSVEDGV
jgi:hypothetical protein